MGYILKETPEDFFVEEIPIEFSGSGPYTVYKLTKIEYNTEKAIQTIANASHIARKAFAYAGSKDKHAHTVQYFSVKSDRDLSTLELKDIEIEKIGQHDEPLSLGSLVGNKFSIVVRHLDTPWAWKEKNALVPNYFDEQRFSAHNVRIGKLLLQKNYKDVCTTLDASYWEIIAHLEKQRHDYAGALQKVPKKILLLYIHAYQSFIFNLTVNKVLEHDACVRIPYSMGEFVFTKESLENQPIPLPGFDPDPEGDIKVLQFISEVLKKEGITNRDFVFHDLKYLSSEGAIRNMLMEVSDIVLEEAEHDTMFPGKMKQKISFTLPKGSYATIFIRFLAAMQ